MGIYVNRANIIEKMRLMRTNMYNTKHQASLIFISINKFNATENELKGKAWNAARRYTSDIQLPVLRLYIECLGMASDACEKYSQAAESLPGFEKLDEDIIMDAKERYERAWDREFMRTHPRQTILNFYEKRIERCEKLLKYIEDFCSEIQGIFMETLSRQEYLHRVLSALKSIRLNEATGEILEPLNNADVQSIKREMARYYADIKQKELEERTKELDEIYNKYGAKAVIKNILTKPVEDCLNTDIEMAEYIMLARLMMESRDAEYVELVNTAVYYCYEYEKTMSNHQGYFNTVNDIYKKSDKVDKILGGLANLGKYVNAKAEMETKENAGLVEDRRRWMQLTQAFLTLSTYDAKIAAPKLYSRDSDIYPAKKKEYDVTVKQDIYHNLIINFLKYGGDVGETSTTPYEEQKSVSIIVGVPESGSGGEMEVQKDVLDYVFYGFGVDKTVAENVIRSSSNCAMTLALGTYAPAVGNAVTIISSGAGISNAVGGGQIEIYNKVKDILEIGQVVKMFNLFYVSSVIKEDGAKKIDTHNWSVFPRYRIDDPEHESTAECIDNFNRNFSKGGKYEKYSNNMEYDENNPITEENLVKRVKEISDMLNQFYDVMREDNMVTHDIENAVRR